MTPTFHKVRTEVLGQVLTYLFQKPYQEVAELIALIQHSEPLDEHVADTEDAHQTSASDRTSGRKKS